MIHCGGWYNDDCMWLAIYDTDGEQNLDGYLRRNLLIDRKI